MNYIKETILSMKDKYKDFISFFDYYEKNWYIYLDSGILGYTKISKLQRCNSYFENYNKIIKNTLGKISKLSWPKFITFIKEQESLYSKKILDIEKTTSYNGAKIYEILKNILYNRFKNDKQTKYVLNNPFYPV